MRSKVNSAQKIDQWQADRKKALLDAAAGSGMDPFALQDLIESQGIW